jgi:bifunctional DNA-binding transcriptional regulator/antitoxin component of YhaV-PrlF toxin-antitoxin module
MKVRIRQDGEETIVLLPDELISSLGWQPGDVLEVRRDGESVTLVRTETEHERGLRIAMEGMEEYRDALQQLAKS